MAGHTEFNRLKIVTSHLGCYLRLVDIKFKFNGTEIRQNKVLTYLSGFA